MNIRRQQIGFTLIEMMVVVAIIGILAAIAYPNYQKHIIKTKRTDMMSEMQNIAKQIESKKLAQGKYTSPTSLEGDYPKQGVALYTVSITPSPLTAKWTITATPKTTGQMKNDGTITLNYQGKKCRVISNTEKYCGIGNQWND